MRTFHHTEKGGTIARFEVSIALEHLRELTRSEFGFELLT